MKIAKIIRSEDYIKFLSLYNKLFQDNVLDLKSFNQLFFCCLKQQETVCYLAFIDNNPVGLIAGTIDVKDKSIYIHFIGVLSNFRQKGVATQLLNKFLLKSFTIYFSGCPQGYLFPGLDEKKYPEGALFFKKKGFSEIRRVYSMKLDLASFDILDYSNFIGNRDYNIVSFEDSYFPDLMSICFVCNHPEWKEVLIKAYYSEKIRKFVKLAIKDGQVLGFACFGVVGNDIKRFGPIAVSPEFRKKKIGLNLTLSVLKNQKELGCRESYFLWVEKDSVALSMYKKIGFDIFSDMSVREFMV